MNKCKHEGCEAEATREGYCWRHRPVPPGAVERERPRQPQKRYRSIRLQVYLRENLVQWLDDVAARRGIHMSTLIGQIVEEAKQRAEAAPTE